MLVNQILSNRISEKGFQLVRGGKVELRVTDKLCFVTNTRFGLNSPQKIRNGGKKSNLILYVSTIKFRQQI